MKKLVQRGKAALVAEGHAFVECPHREHGFVEQVFFHAVDPFFFRTGKAVGLLQAGHGTADAFLVPQQARVDAVTADQSDDVGRNVLVAHLGHGGIELPGGEAFPPQGQAQAFEAFAGQIRGARANKVHGGDLVAPLPHEAGKGFQVVAGAEAILAVPASMAGERIRGVGQDDGPSAGPLGLQKVEQSAFGQQQSFGLIRGQVPQLLDERLERAAGHVVDVLPQLVRQGALAALQAGDDLTYLVLELRGVFHDFQTVQELGERGCRIPCHRAHGRDRLKDGIQIHSVVDLKVLFADLRAEPGGTAEHLFEQDAGLHPAQEDQAGDLGHVDARGEQIHGHHDAGQGFVLELADGSVDILAVAYAAGDLHDRVRVHQLRSIQLLEDTDDHVRMAVVDGVDEGLAGGGILGVDVPDDLPQDLPVEIFVDHGLVEIVHIKIQLVFQLGAVDDLAGDRIIQGHGVPGLVVDALFTELCAELVRGLVIHQKTVDHRFTVGVVEDRLAEYLCGLERRGGCQRYLDRPEIVDDLAVFALVVALVAVELLIIAHLPVKDIAPMGLVDDDQVIVGDGRHGIAAFIVLDAFDHALHGGHMDTGLRIYLLVRQSLDGIDAVQGLELLDLYVFEDIECLCAQGIAVHEEEDAAETPAFQKAVHHPQHCPGLACARRHGQQDVLCAFAYSLLGRRDGAQLVFHAG